MLLSQEEEKQEEGKERMRKGAGGRGAGDAERGRAARLLDDELEFGGGVSSGGVFEIDIIRTGGYT
jgi:hypothetical protein